MPSKESSVQTSVSAISSQVAQDTISYTGICSSPPQTLLISNPGGVDPLVLCLRQEQERARALSRDPEIKSCSLGFRK